MSSKTISFIVLNILIADFLSAKITILTQPVQRATSDHWYHKAVTESLIRGLKMIAADFNFNPQHIADVGEDVIVLANKDALKQAIRWKQRKRIKKLLVGPNLFVRPQEIESLITSPSIDLIMEPSNWPIKAVIEDCPQLHAKLVRWPAGVNSEYWQPQTPLKDRRSTNVLVYQKNGSQYLLNSVIQLLRKYEWNPIVITYGKYEQRHFKDLLSRVQFAVFLSRSESQGLALAEAWAMDVPTFAWNLGGPLTIQGKIYTDISACPYLNPLVGQEWKSLDIFEAQLGKIQTILNNCSPRAWVLQHMTDEISALIVMRYLTQNHKSHNKIIDED